MTDKQNLPSYNSKHTFQHFSETTLCAARNEMCKEERRRRTSMDKRPANWHGRPETRDQRPERKKEQETTKLQAGLILVTCELLPWHLFINRRKVYGKVWKQQHQLCTCSGLFVAKGRIKQMQKANSHRLFLNSSANIQSILLW